MTAAGAVIWTVLALGSQPSQAQAPPPTALIVGRVVDAASGRPVAGAIVALDGAGAVPVLPGGPNSSRQPRAMTNASGQFVFRKLAKGSYNLSATRPGYVGGAYGRKQPSGSTASLQLDEGERASDVVIPMWRQAVIGGTVTDESGEPLIGVQVRAFQRRFLAGRNRLLPGPLATTDDRGVYRMPALTPGDYIVAFIWRETSVPAATAELMRSGGLNDPKIEPIFRERISFSPMIGVPGSSTVVQIGASAVDLPVGAPVPPAAPDANALFIYPTQFYPGVPSAARAATITLSSGQERAGIDFSLRPVKTFRVSGTLVGAEGPVPNAALRLAPAGEETLTDADTSATMTDAGGAFTLLGVVPGQYTIKVLRTPRPAPPPSTMTSVQMGASTVMSMSGPNPGAAPPPISDDPTMFAELPVAVGNADVTDVLVTLQRGARMTGRLEFDGTRERPDRAALTRITIALAGADPTSSPVFSQLSAPPPPGRADETGAFKTYGMAAGRYTVRVSGIPQGWTLRSVTTDGRDISEVPIDLRSADVTNVVVTFTDRSTTLTGTARGSSGNADPDAVVVVLPADSPGWSEYGLNPRRVRSTRAGRNGAYTLSGLPPGEYHVAAIHDDTFPQWQDPRVLEEIARSGSLVRLAEGDTRTQDVKTIAGGAR